MKIKRRENGTRRGLKWFVFSMKIIWTKMKIFQRHWTSEVFGFGGEHRSSESWLCLSTRIREVSQPVKTKKIKKKRRDFLSSPWKLRHFNERNLATMERKSNRRSESHRSFDESRSTWSSIWFNKSFHKIPWKRSLKIFPWKKSAKLFFLSFNEKLHLLEDMRLRKFDNYARIIQRAMKRYCAVRVYQRQREQGF